MVTNPWSGQVETRFWTDNLYESEYLHGVWGTVGDMKRGRDWDWCIEVFLGSIWHACQGDFDSFIHELNRTWLEEFLHMVFRWERVEQGWGLVLDEERPVRAWVKLLLEG
jgi:hypothetical protein